MDVLLIDDDAEMLESIADAVSERGHTVTSATTDSEALAALQRERFDVVVCDFDLGLLSILNGTQILDSEFIPAESTTVLFSGLSRSKEVAAMRRAPDRVITKDDVFSLLDLFPRA